MALVYFYEILLGDLSGRGDLARHRDKWQSRGVISLSPKQAAH